MSGASAIYERLIKVLVTRPLFRSKVGYLFLLPGILFASLVCPAACLADEGNNVSIGLERVEVWPDVQDYFIADLDGDGQDDFFRLYSDHHTYQATPFSRERFLAPAMYQGNASHWIEKAFPVELDTLPGREVAVSLKDLTGDSAWIEIHAGFDKGNILCRTEAVIGKDISDKDNHKNPGWDGHFSFVYAADLDDDNLPEIVASLSVGFDLYPRGIYVFDYPSGKIKWSFPLAGNPQNLVIEDANRDGFKEVYFRTWCCANGAEVEGRTDGEAYIFCLDHLGHVIWKQKLGDRFDFQTGNFLICDCDHDDTLEIYYTMLLRQEEYDRQVRVLEKHRAVDNHFMRQHSFDAVDQYNQIYTADIDGDKEQELVTDGSLIIIDPSDLSIEKQGAMRGQWVAAIVDIDLTEDSLSELIIRGRDSVKICDAGFRPLVTLGLTGGRYIGDVRYFKNPFGGRFIGIKGYLNHQNGNDELSIYEIKTVSGRQAGGLFDFLDKSWLMVLIGLGLGTIVGYYVLPRRRLHRSVRRLPHTAQYNNLLETLVNFNHGRMAGKNLNRLLFLFSNLPEDQQKLDEIKTNLRSAVSAYHSFTAAQLHNIVAHSLKLRPIDQVTEALNRDILKLTEALENLSINDIDVNKAASLKKALPPLIESIKAAIRKIRKHLQGHFSSNILQVFPEVLAAIADQFQQQKVGFNEIVTRGGVNQLIFFDPIELAAIFEELLTNATIAMEESSVRELSLNIDFGGGEVIIRLSDTGRGLPAAGEERVFDRDYSTRGKEHGYGLYHARRQVERFGGRIRIYNRENGPGTTVELVLKTISDD